ncbi:MAG: hypothetical protein CO093_10175 [Alphaproteobacteria bacterium CG_4_9_14_3_um_filter_47_13]|nr:MAG: hypothetical protein CO093_10175 [Alphaproteobacteria bacterium CG_4_9_14_3_um_filter_47_13]
MVISYAQKQDILDYLSNKNHWENRFNTDIFSDEKRKWPIRISNDIKHATSKDKTKAFITCEKTGATLLFEKSGASLSIQDESGRKLVIQDDGTPAKERGDVGLKPFEWSTDNNFYDPGSSDYDFSEMGVSIHFASSGEKTVFFENSGEKAAFGKPDMPLEQATHPGRFFHVISFNLAAAQEWGMTIQTLLDSAKLIVAKDFDIEPDLGAVNELDPDLVQKQDSVAVLERVRDLAESNSKEENMNKESPEQGKATLLRKPWHDATDFSGHYIATPQRFFVKATDDGFEMALPLEYKERILAHGQIFKNAIELQKSARSTSYEVTAQGCLDILEKGANAKDQSGRIWSYAVVQMPNAAEAAGEIRKIAKDYYGLSGDDVSVINFEKDLCMLAMDKDVLARTSLAMKASQEMMALIKGDSKKGVLVENLLGQGADYRYINPEEAKKGRTFADEMKESGRDDLLRVLKKITGVHGFAPSPTFS